MDLNTPLVAALSSGATFVATRIWDYFDKGRTHRWDLDVRAEERRHHSEERERERADKKAADLRQAYATWASFLEQSGDDRMNSLLATGRKREVQEKQIQTFNKARFQSREEMRLHEDRELAIAGGWAKQEASAVRTSRISARKATRAMVSLLLLEPETARQHEIRRIEISFKPVGEKDELANSDGYVKLIERYRVSLFAAREKLYDFLERIV